SIRFFVSSRRFSCSCFPRSSCPPAARAAVSRCSWAAFVSFRRSSSSRRRSRSPISFSRAARSGSSFAAIWPWSRTSASRAPRAFRRSDRSSSAADDRTHRSCFASRSCISLEPASRAAWSCATPAHIAYRPLFVPDTPLHRFSVPRDLEVRFLLGREAAGDFPPLVPLAESHPHIPVRPAHIREFHALDVRPSRLAVQGERDGVQDRGFPGTGPARNHRVFLGKSERRDRLLEVAHEPAHLDL